MADYLSAKQRLKAMYPELRQLIGYVSANAHGYDDDPIARTIRQWVSEEDTDLLQKAITQLDEATKHLPVTVGELSAMSNYTLESDEDARQLLLALRDGLQAGLKARPKKNT